LVPAKLEWDFCLSIDIHDGKIPEDYQDIVV
jgi:hypothetical protein